MSPGTRFASAVPGYGVLFFPHQNHYLERQMEAEQICGVRVGETKTSKTIKKPAKIVPPEMTAWMKKQESSYKQSAKTK